MCNVAGWLETKPRFDSDDEIFRGELAMERRTEEVEGL